MMKKISALTLIFCMALSLGNTVLAEEGDRGPGHKKPDLGPVFAEMQLSDDQQTELEALLKAHHDARRELGRSAGREAHEALRDQHSLDLANLLTPEQLTILEAFRSQNRPPRRSKKVDYKQDSI